MHIIGKLGFLLCLLGFTAACKIYRKYCQTNMDCCSRNCVFETKLCGYEVPAYCPPHCRPRRSPRAKINIYTTG